MSFCVYVHVCMYVPCLCVSLCMGLCMHFVHVCMEARDCLLMSSPAEFLRQGLSLSPEFVDLAMLAGQ